MVRALSSPFSIDRTPSVGNEKPTEIGRFCTIARRTGPSSAPRGGTASRPEVRPRNVAKGLLTNRLRPNARGSEHLRYHSNVLRVVPTVGVLLCLAGSPRPQYLAPYVATPEDVVDRMLALAATTAKDTVYDLGCGDGRIPIAAAKRYGAHGVGLDLDATLVEQAKANAKAAGVEDLVDFRVQNVLEADVSPATVVTLYLLSSSNARLRPLLQKQLAPGARIVSHAFSMGREWPADKIDQFVSARGDEVTLYLWRIKP
jgi:SAM-dependent methyltransferase